MLGTDDRRRKLYVRFWSNYGYPRPYKIKSEAENHMLLLKLLRAIDITQDSSDLMTSYKVKAILSRRQFILQKFEFLFSIVSDIEQQGKTQCVYDLHEF